MNVSALLEKIPELVLSFGLNILLALALFFVGKWIAKRLVTVIGSLMTAHGLDPTIGGFVSNIAFMVLMALIIIAALAQLGVPTASFIAIIGAAGLAIGLALQGSLSNFASGVLLVSFRPCKLGDYIEGAGVSGTVDKITVFSTTLITPDQRTIVVPNSSLLSGPIINYTTSPSRRLDLVIGVGYDSNIDQVKSLLRDIVESDSRVLEDKKPVQIGVLALADSAINFAVRPWVANEDYLSLKFDLHERIKEQLDAAGITIPYPQLQVNVDSSVVAPNG